MTRDDLPRLVRVLAVLGETFNETVSDVRTEGYLMGLNDLSIEDVECGARQALKTSKFFPRPAELRELAGGSLDDESEMAWLTLVGEVRRVGSYGLPSALTNEIIDAMACVWGSWTRLCSMLPSEGPGFTAMSKTFKNAYKSLHHKGRGQIASAPQGMLDA